MVEYREKVELSYSTHAHSLGPVPNSFLPQAPDSPLEGAPLWSGPGCIVFVVDYHVDCLIIVIVVVVVVVTVVVVAVVIVMEVSSCGRGWWWCVVLIKTDGGSCKYLNTL